MSGSRQNHVTGIVLCQGRVFKITVPSPFLVFDAVSWTQSQKALIADQAHESETAGDLESAREDFELVRELEHWLQHRAQPVRALPLLALRQAVQPHVIRLSSIYLWLNYLFTLHRKDFEGEIEFLFEVTSEGATLSVLPRLRAQARHTGMEIHGQIISSQSMADRLIQPLRESIIDPLDNERSGSPVFQLPVSAPMLLSKLSP